MEITGGSSGIGKCLAIEAIKNGAHVSIVARNSSLLEEARVEILKFVSSTTEQKVSCYSGNISKYFFKQKVNSKFKLS